MRNLIVIGIFYCSFISFGFAKMPEWCKSEVDEGTMITGDETERIAFVNRLILKRIELHNTCNARLGSLSKVKKNLACAMTEGSQREIDQATDFLKQIDTGDFCVYVQPGGLISVLFQHNGKADDVHRYTLQAPAGDYDKYYEDYMREITSTNNFAKLIFEIVELKKKVNFLAEPQTPVRPQVNFLVEPQTPVRPHTQ